jgi:hypothetical protein
MGDETDTEGQRILDARMEYGHLITTYISLANMIWLGYGAFFTINTLLATGLGFSYSETAKSLDQKLLTLVHVLIPVTGMFISLVAIYAAVLISEYERLAVMRGRELETLLFAKIFKQLSAAKYPVGTIIGSLLFFAIWFGTLYAGLT